MRKLRRTLAWFAAIVASLVAAALLHTFVLDGPRVVRVTPVRSTPAVEVQFPAAALGVSVGLSGRVESIDGVPIVGAMVTGSDAIGHRRITVFSGPDGRYELSLPFDGEIGLRARVRSFADVAERRRLSDGERVAVDFTMATITSPQAISDQLTASAHAATLAWSDAPLRETFVSQCHFCHQIGNALTRRPRPYEEWEATVDRMEGYLVLVTSEQKQGITETLSRSFVGAPVTTLQTRDVSPELHRARMEEWTAGDPLSFIHDAEVGADGLLYGVDEGHDVIWTLDRASGEVTSRAIPDVQDLAVGGRFAGLALPIGIFTGRTGPHSLAQGADGRFWITGALSSTLSSFDPATGEIATYPIGGDSLYPHTVRIDAEGIVWFTMAASNQVGRFDPATSTFTILDLPSVTLNGWIADAMFPTTLRIAARFPRKNVHLALSHHDVTGAGRFVLNMPYGIDVSPTDGSVWYAKLYASRIGRIDPDSFEIVEYETPEPGPRRPRFDPEGHLWIPSFDTGAILRFDPDTERFERFELPTLSPGEYETPYALNVDRATGDVWVTSNLSDRVFRFDPARGEFTSYPSPTRVTYLRDLVFTEDGQICSAHSNLPAYAIEGGMPAFVCIDPDGAVGDSPAAD